MARGARAAPERRCEQSGVPQDLSGAVLVLDVEPAVSVFGRRFLDVACAHYRPLGAARHGEGSMQKAQQQHRGARGLFARTVGELFMENWMADNGWVFTG